MVYLKGKNGVESGENQLYKFLYLLRKGYSCSHLPTKHDLKTEDHDEFYHAFENSYWGISREGLANIIVESGNEKTDEFYNKTYPQRVNNFFHMYIMALHQYYALLSLANRISKLERDADHYCKDTNYNDLEELKKDVNFFYMSCIFEDVSLFTHQNHIYKKTREVLGIKNLEREVYKSMDLVVGLIDDVRKKKEEERRDKLQRKLNAISIVGFMFLVVTTFNVLYDLVGKLYIEDKNTFEICSNIFFRYAAGIMGVLLLMSFVVWLVYFLYSTFKK